MKLLEIRNLEKSFGENKVVKGISFDISRGESIGFLGPNGAGKSTTINMIATLLNRDNGEIKFKGLSSKEDLTELKKSIGVVPQDIAIFEDLSAFDNVKFFCSLYGYKGKELKDRTDNALRSVGLYDRRKDYPKAFSGGMKRRLNIACSIAHDPEILIMDEPTVGIDPQSRNNILATVKKLNQNGTSILYVSHYMEEVETLCDRIVIIDNGEILRDQSKKSLMNDFNASGGANALEYIFLELTGTDLRDQEA